MSARSGLMRASSAVTYAVTSTPLILTPSNMPSMSTFTNHTSDIFTFVRLAPSNRASVRSTSRNCRAAQVGAFEVGHGEIRHGGVFQRDPAQNPDRTVETMGLEPTTPCLQSRCSSQLSYVPERQPA